MFESRMCCMHQKSKKITFPKFREAGRGKWTGLSVFSAPSLPCIAQACSRHLYQNLIFPLRFYFLKKNAYYCNPIFTG